RPRRRRYAATISGMTSMAGRMRESISSGQGGLSGSLNAPALISASSSSVIVASWRNALRRASCQIASCRFDIFPHISFFALAQTNDPDHFVVTNMATSEHENVEPIADKAPCHFAQLSIVLAVVDFDVGGGPVEFVGSREINSMLREVRRSLDLVPIVERLRIHDLPDSLVRRARQVNRSYNFLAGAAA